MSDYKRLLEFVKPYWRKLLFAMLFTMVYSTTAGAQAWLVKPIVDRIFVQKDARMLWILPAIVVAISLIRGGAGYGQSYLMAFVGQKVIMDLRDSICHHLQDLSLSFFHKTPTGMLISRITNDVNMVQEGVTNALTGTLKDGMTMIVLVVVVIYNDWFLALVGLVFLPVMGIPIVYFGKKIRHIAKRSQAQLGTLTTVLHETITGQPIIKAFCAEDKEKERFSRESGLLFRTIMKRFQVRALSSPLMETLAGMGIGMAVYAGGYRILEGKLTPGEFFSFVAAMGLLYEPAKRLNRLNLLVQEARAAAERIYQILDIKPEIQEKKNAVTIEPIRENIVFQDVSFRYEEEEVLSGINLEIKKGEIIALVGESGGGKTTLAHLIPRFFDVSKGAILLDGTDIRDATFKSLRGQVALVTQQSILFNDTAGSNIAYGKPEASEEEIRAAAKAAHAHDFIKYLPEGYDSVIGEGGVKLSGGQKQRLCIARALLKNAPILILDEATSSLDSESEEEVQSALEKLMVDRTVLVIAHRLSTIRNAHRIVVVKKGQIVETGTHDALMDKRGEYFRLYRMQNFGGKEPVRTSDSHMA